MDNWKERFSQKVEIVRQASRERFDRTADESFMPTFEEFKEFTRLQGFQASVPLAKPGIRSFKFAIAENAYLLMTLRLVGLEHCEMQCEFFMPHHKKLESITERQPLGDVEEPWMKELFQRILDMFLDAYLEACEHEAGVQTELVDAS